MTKTHTTLTIDGEVLDKAKALQINISGEFQKFLEKMVMTYESDVEGINLELLNIELAKLKTNKMKIDMELQSKLRTKEMLENIIKQKDEERLKQEKEAIENAKKCINCGRTIEEGNTSHKFGKGIVCHSCFMSADGSAVKRWKNG